MKPKTLKDVALSHPRGSLVVISEQTALELLSATYDRILALHGSSSEYEVITQLVRYCGVNGAQDDHVVWYGRKITIKD